MSEPVLLVPGGHGQLGSEIGAGAGRGWPGRLWRPGSAELDVTDGAVVSGWLDRLPPGSVVLNCAAHTAVDSAESEPARSHSINAEAAGVLANGCRQRGLPMVHMSTDYVFGTTRSGGRALEPDDPVRPDSVYGSSKLAGERLVLADGGPDSVVVRTSWVYGAYGSNFVATMCRLAREGRDPVVVDDQVGSPTWTGELAPALLALCDRLRAGQLPATRILHAAGAGRASWFELARAVFAECGADTARVRPCGTEQFPRPAQRPAFSVLSGRSWRAAGLPQLSHWRAALAEALAARPFSSAHLNSAQRPGVVGETR